MNTQISIKFSIFFVCIFFLWAAELMAGKTGACSITAETPSELQQRITADKKFLRWKKTQSTSRIGFVKDLERSSGAVDNFGNIEGDVLELRLKVQEQRNIERELIYRYSTENEMAYKESVVKLTKDGTLKRMYLKSRIGNCGECVDGLTPTLLKDYKSVDRIESVNMFPKHSFLIVNRAPLTELNNPLSWNPEALVVDPWIGKVYTVDEFNALGTGVPFQGSDLYYSATQEYSVNYDISREGYYKVENLLKTM